MAFNIGENIGAYRIIEQLGQGGMATVYKAYHAALDRYVALKVLHAAFHDDQTFTARFQREARVVARLEHPNIVPIYDYSEHEARPYLVMKYIEGDTLKARLNKGPLSSREIEQVVDSVGSALGYAHRQGILHRDIKPSNVLIATDGVMYLADFGLARIASAGESTLSSDSIMGTPQYISPEQAMGKKDLDAGTDIYSFAVMLYEMVVGQVPFTADTPFSIIHDHIYTPLPLPMDVNPNVPEPVQRVLLKALAKNRLDRYESVEEMIAAFKASWAEAGIPMQGTAITMRPGSLKAPTKSQPKAQSEATAAKTVAVQSAAPKRSSPGCGSALDWSPSYVLESHSLLFGEIALRFAPRRHLLLLPLWLPLR
jgi:serine/threonine protein kinase